MGADLLLNANFPDEEFAKYRQRTLAALQQQRSSAGFLAQELWLKVMYGDHPASRSSITPANLSTITRAQMVEFHRARYVPDHAILAIAGDISYAAAQKLVESHLGSWKKAGVPTPVANDPPAAGTGRVHFVDRPTSVQTNFIVGTPGIARTDPDYTALQLMNAVVGGGPTGRLFMHLREEKGYTYGAYSGMTAGRFRGTWNASTEVRSEVTEPALTDLLDELRQIRDVTVPAKELQDKKRSLVAGFALSLESPQQMLGYYVTSKVYRLPADYWDRYPQQIMSVTADQVQAVARKYLEPSRVQIVSVGDGKKVESVLGKFGAVDVYDTEGKRVDRVVPLYVGCRPE
jgi:zinc protease